MYVCAYICMYVCISVCMHECLFRKDVHATVPEWRSEDHFPELVLSFHFTESLGWTSLHQSWQQTPL